MLCVISIACLPALRPNRKRWILIAFSETHIKQTDSVSSGRYLEGFYEQTISLVEVQ